MSVFYTNNTDYFMDICFVFLTSLALSFHSKLCCCSVRHACQTKPYWELYTPYFNRFLLHEAESLERFAYEIQVLQTAVGIARFPAAFNDQATTVNFHDSDEVHFCMI